MRTQKRVLKPNKEEAVNKEKCLESTMELSSSIDMLKNKIIETIESASNERNIWKSLLEISSLSKISVNEINIVLSKSDPNSYLGSFVENKFGKITTRNLYRRFTPFLTKFIHSFQCRID